MMLFHKISSVEKVTFTQHMSVMLKSGVPLAEALNILTIQNTNATLRNHIIEIEKDVSNGIPFSKALARQGIFDNFYISLVEMGERSGNLEKNLDYLATKLHKDYQFNQKVVSASLYPTIILATAFSVGTMISLFVLPKLVDLFDSLDVDLPLTTKILIWFSHLMKNYGIHIFGSFLIIAVLFRLLLRIPKYRIKWQTLLLNIPIVGSFITNVQLTSICRNLGILIQSGIPLNIGLESLINSTDHLVYKNYLTYIYNDINKGISIAQALNIKNLKYFPAIASKMVGVGEKTGTLDGNLLYLADFFENEVDTASKDLSSVLEPILLFVIGVVVAFLALAIISPIYQFTGSVHR